MVSSANREIEDLKFVPISLTYTRKSKGPSMGHFYFVYQKGTDTSRRENFGSSLLLRRFSAVHVIG